VNVAGSRTSLFGDVGVVRLDVPVDEDRARLGGTSGGRAGVEALAVVEAVVVVVLELCVALDTGAWVVVAAAVCELVETAEEPPHAASSSAEAIESRASRRVIRPSIDRPR
jgi:hypothetical protein